MTEKKPFGEARRELTSLLAPAEKRALLWMAARTPSWVNADHLTLLGLAAMLAAGVFYYLSAVNSAYLHLVNLSLAVNWLGDSLDGTLARYRQKTRPRYGFYVDHIVDAFGAFFLLGGLGLSGFMTERIALLLLAVWFALQINIYLITYTAGVFKISYGPFGGTELRILLAIANLILMVQPRATIAGRSVLMADMAGLVGIVGLTIVLIVSTWRTTAKLYREERI